MRILLVKCPRLYVSHFKEYSESLALGCLASSLRKNNFETDLLDASLEGLSLTKTLNKISAKKYDLIGFTIADPTFIESTSEVIKNLRQEGVTSHITMGGQSPTFHYDEILKMCPGLDSISMFEGEETIVELAKALMLNQEWQRIRNLAYRDNSEIKYNSPRPLIKDLDSLPFPSRDTVPYILKHKKEDGVVSMAGGRGCPMNCGFCSIRAFYNAPGGPLWRIRSNLNVVEEMEHLVNTFGVNEILMVDDVIMGPGEKNKQRILNLTDEIENRHLSIMLSAAERVDNIDKGIFQRLKDIGVRNILIGIESGNQEMLNRFNKGITIDQITKAIETLQQLDIDITVSFINFNPWIILEQIEKNIDFFVSLKVNILQGLLNRFQIYSGTPLGDQMLKTDYVKGTFPNYVCQSFDNRVDLAYEIAQKTLGTFLATADTLNKVQRKIRKKIFKAEVEENRDLIIIFKKEKKQYRKIMNKIIEEAANLLREVIIFASNKNRDKDSIRDFTEEMRKNSLEMYKEWQGLIEFFKCYSATYNGVRISNRSLS